MILPSTNNNDVNIATIITGGECKVLNALQPIFNKQKAFYRGSSSSSHHHHHQHNMHNHYNNNKNHQVHPHHQSSNMPLAQGMPEIRIKMMEKFRLLGGLQALTQYLHYQRLKMLLLLQRSSSSFSTLGVISATAATATGMNEDHPSVNHHANNAMSLPVPSSSSTIP
jgi:hypothetical protein